MQISSISLHRVSLFFFCKSFLPYIDLGTFSSSIWLFSAVVVVVATVAATVTFLSIAMWSNGTGICSGGWTPMPSVICWSDVCVWAPFVSFHKTTMSLASTSLSQQRQVFSLFHRYNTPKSWGQNEEWNSVPKRVCVLEQTNEQEWERPKRILIRKNEK